MTRFTTRRLDPGSDNGATLLVVLIVVGVLGILLAGLSTFGATAELDTMALGDQAGTVYGAGSGVTAAIKGAVSDTNWGLATSVTDTGSCPTLSLPAAGTSPAITVNCHYWAGSGYQLTVGGTPPHTVTQRPPNSPHYAILATAASETGITVGGNSTTVNGPGVLQIDGPIRSNSPLLTGNGSINTATQAALSAGTDPSTSTPNPITAHGVCTGPATNYVPACVTDPVDAGVTGSDNYDTNGDWVTESMPAAADASVYRAASDISGHCGVGSPLLPGIYQDADALNTLIAGCSSPNVVWFRPGVYYFDFRTSTNHVLSIANAGTHVVGGQLSSTPLTPGSACLTDTTTPAATSGVQWVFGSDSRVSVTAGSLDLCPIPTPITGTRQEISLYGLRHGQTFGASAPYQVTPGTANDVNGNGNGNFTNESAGRVIDGTSARYPWPTSSPRKTGAISLGSFNLSSFLAATPPGSTVSADLDVNYASTRRSFSGVSLTLKDGDGSVCYQSSGASMCANGTLSTSTVMTQGSAAETTADQHFALPGGSAPTINGLSTLTAEFDASPISGGNVADGASIDGAVLTLTYTPPPFRAQNGCVTLAGGCGGTAPTFFYADGSNSRVSVSGSLYAWNSSISVNLPNQIETAFKRGAVARTFSLNVPNSGTAQTVVGLPPAQTITIPGTPGTIISNHRKLTLTANVTGSPGSGVVTAVVDIGPTGNVTILSWNGKPCGSGGCP